MIHLVNMWQYNGICNRFTHLYFKILKLKRDTYVSRLFMLTWKVWPILFTLYSFKLILAAILDAILVKMYPYNVICNIYTHKYCIFFKEVLNHFKCFMHYVTGCPRFIYSIFIFFWQPFWIPSCLIYGSIITL